MSRRGPIIPLAVEEDEDYVQLHSDGSWRAAPKIIHSKETIGAMRAGYVCAKCWENHDRPFPEQCNACRFPMKDRQSEYLAKAYQGEIQMGPSASLEDELAAMEELEKRKAREATVSAPQIIVPRVF